MKGNILLLLVAAAVSGIPPPERCERHWVKIGCYHDPVTEDRPLPGELVNHRDLMSLNTDGHLLDWIEWDISMHALACKCAEETRKLSHRYFGLQFYGECWSGNQSALRYFKDGPSTTCISSGYNKCDDKSNLECVGEAFTNYIYSVGIDGGLTHWAPWEDCSATCGGGKSWRTRSCSNPTPSFGGKPCVGELKETRTCNERECPVDGIWSAWEEWGSCTVSCGKGRMGRTRKCDNPAPSNNGKPCEGVAAEMKTCYSRPCPIDGGWCPWSLFTFCTVPCGGGVKMRSRQCTEPYPLYGGKPCEGPGINTMSCNPEPCKIDGGFTEWGQWESCTADCGGGFTFRSRSCTNPRPEGGGDPCQGDFAERKTCNKDPCPIDGKYSDWNAWSTCPTTCGPGEQRRTRTCTNPSPSFGGKPCDGPSDDQQTCNIKPCPIDGQYGDFSDWSECSVTCGGGTRDRSRQCNNPAPQFGGSPCQGLAIDREICNPNPCPVDGGYSRWSMWNECSAPCGPGTQSKERACTNPEPQYGGKPCEGDNKESRPCEIKKCPIDGAYSTWGPWMPECSATCGGGTSVRSRTCTNPQPQFGGKDCEGINGEEKKCNEQPCPIDGVYSPWGAWGKCTKSCGTGEQSASRTCTNPAPQFGGKDCVGNADITRKCNDFPCPIDGGYSEWEIRIECAACGGGIREYTRSCNNPPPQFAGKPCEGDTTRTEACLTDPCPIDGNYTSWSVWGQCSVTCGGGTQGRDRSCTNPRPQYNGKDCSSLGADSESMECNVNPCPIDGKYQEWEQWSDCSVTCGGGSQKRSRVCDNPQHGGSPCFGPADEIRDCSPYGCPVDGGFGDWTPWEDCTLTCGGGFQNRSRQCDNPRPANNGKPCDGDWGENRTCNLAPCPIDGGYSDWSAWEECSFTCGNGTQFRRRVCNSPTPQYGGDPCVDVSYETQGCNPKPCPIDGDYLEWSEWTKCSKSCGGGERTRSRTCNAPQFGGKPCAGPAAQSEPCNSNSCPIDGGYTSWTGYTPCSENCGGGTQKKERFCTNPAPQFNGLPCSGASSMSKECNVDPCPIDGGFTTWINWSTCNKECGTGVQSRARACTSPAPQFGGKDCDGSVTETRPCNINPCPIDGGYTTWTAWGKCSVSCGGAIHSRSRECTNPAPQHGGKDCQDVDFESRICNANPCPIDGGYTAWAEWSTCDKQCGGGDQSRARTCTRPAPQFGGKDCVLPPTESRKCNEQPCPIDGQYSAWSSWGSCSKECGGGRRSKSRTCTNPAPANGGKPCQGADIEDEDCNSQPCAIDGGFTPYSEWGQCTKTCGGGTETRTRSCTNPIAQFGGKPCEGATSETRSCNNQECPIDGGYTSWSVYSECDVTCGGGSQGRTRTCTNPSPAFGGKPCVGEQQESMKCNEQPCPIDGGYTTWGDWSECSLTCGKGMNTRARTCTNPVPQNGGRPCEGPNTETAYCNTYHCPIDGGYTSWSAFDECTKSCGGGVHTSRRECSNPIPQFNGKECEGEASKTAECNAQPCPIDGGYTEWSAWGKCSKSCGGGQRSSSRTCTNPSPLYGGKSCSDSSQKTEECNQQPCPIDGQYSEWNDWTSCDKICGGGIQEKTRLCNSPAPANDGKDCVGSPTMTQSCNQLPCPVDGGYSDWMMWTVCTVKCGGGTQTKTRTCTNPVPQNGGKVCEGIDFESQTCGNAPCPIDGKVSDWSQWADCSVSCGGGKRVRSRTCTNPAPQFGGKDCQENLTQDETCGDSICPIHGNYTAWTSWSECSVTCGQGVTGRTRTCDNPIPQYGGDDCVGDPTETQKCLLPICAVVEIEGEPIQTCNKTLDIGVVMDASKSVGAANYQKMKNFFIGLTMVTTVSENGTHFAVLHYSSAPFTDVKFTQTQYWDRDTLEAKINRIFYSKGATETEDALNRANRDFYCDTCGLRTDSAKVLIVMTDGKSSSTPEQLGTAAQVIKDKGITVLSIGIGETVDLDELVYMANDEGHVFYLNDFDELLSRLQNILDLSCGKFSDEV